jgi:hypothetical protein
MTARKTVGLCSCLRLTQHFCSHSWSPFEVSFCQSRLTESREEPTMKPESPRLEDAYTGRQGNESWEEPPRFRRHASAGLGLSTDSRPTRGFPPASSSVNSLRGRDARALSTNRRVFLTRPGSSRRLRQKRRCRPWIRHALANHIHELAVVHRLLEESCGSRLQRLLFVELRTTGGQHNDGDTR